MIASAPGAGHDEGAVMLLRVFEDEHSVDTVLGVFDVKVSQPHTHHSVAVRMGAPGHRIAVSTLISEPRHKMTPF